MTPPISDIVKKKKKTRKNEHTTHRSIEERKKKATRFESINEAGARFESCCVFSGTPRDDWRSWYRITNSLLISSDWLGAIDASRNPALGLSKVKVTMRKANKSSLGSYYKAALWDQTEISPTVLRQGFPERFGRAEILAVVCTFFVHARRITHFFPLRRVFLSCGVRHRPDVRWHDAAPAAYRVSVSDGQGSTARSKFKKASHPTNAGMPLPAFLCLSFFSYTRTADTLSVGDDYKSFHWRALEEKKLRLGLRHMKTFRPIFRSSKR